MANLFGGIRFVHIVQLISVISLTAISRITKETLQNISTERDRQLIKFASMFCFIP